MPDTSPGLTQESPETAGRDRRRRPGPLARLDRIPVWPYERKLLWVVGAGYFFAFFDIVTISFAAPVIATQFHVAKSTVALSVTSSLIGYIVGAFADATIADKWGRRLSLTLSVGVFSLGTVLAAASTNVTELIIFRFIAGLGIGAEIAAVTTYIGELSPAPLRGRYTSWATTAAYAGFAVVPFIARGLVPSFASGWRILFLIGALGGLTILFMRRSLPPSPRWLMTQGRVEEAENVVAGAEESARETIDGELPTPEAVPQEAKAERFPVRALLSPTMIKRVGLFVGIWFVYYLGNYGWLTLAPTLFTDKGYSLADSTTYLLVSGIGFLVGAYATTRFSDRLERKFAAAAVTVVWAISLLVIGLFVSPTIIIVFGFIASMTIGLLVPMLYTYTAEHFATNARATGVALTDGLGHIGGALAPPIVLGANAAWGFSGAFVVMAISGVVAGALILLGIRTTGRSLESTATSS
ncbi:MAG: transporter, putative metabolite:H+ symporter [Solirubrobacteraceae bacterium]|jgi:putative MFS transporter|nr:transporter, putative metabolite:H+ symporter [Solirubrobacteraceae bacterium]